MDQPTPTPHPNAGRFRPGDVRINHAGRPKGKKPRAGADIDPADIATQAGQRLRRLAVPRGELARRIVNSRAFFILNLPKGFEIVGVRMDERHGAIVFLLRSPSFEQVAKGSVIPAWDPKGDGVRSWAETPEYKSAWDITE